jgi:hypothetical protein
VCLQLETIYEETNSKLRSRLTHYLADPRKPLERRLRRKELDEVFCLSMHM